MSNKYRQAAIPHMFSSFPLTFPRVLYSVSPVSSVISCVFPSVYFSLFSILGLTIEFITKPEYWIVCTGSMTEFLKFITNPKWGRRTIMVSLSSGSLSID